LKLREMEKKKRDVEEIEGEDPTSHFIVSY
jgi:hypothetical protein